MADAADMANDIVDEHLARGLSSLRPELAPGVSGECDGCGYDMPRLVNGRCGYCRDGRENPGDTPVRATRAWVLPTKSLTKAGVEAAGEEAPVVEPTSRRSTVARVAVTAGETAGGEVAPPASPPTSFMEPAMFAPKQINSRIAAADLEQVKALAAADDVSISAMASDLILEALAARQTCKPMIRADVIRAARTDGVPLEQFVTMLIAIGMSARGVDGAA